MNIKQAIKQWLFGEDIQSKLIDRIYGTSFNKTEAGLTVNQSTVATHGDVFTCVKILSTSVGQLPVILNKDTDGNKIPQSNTVLSEIFTKKPNFYQTTQEFIEQGVSCLALRGNFYAEIVRNRYGNISQIIPFYRQEQVDVVMETDGSIQYTYTTNDSKTGVEYKTTFNQIDVLHIKMNSYDGYIGASPLTQARRELGISLATEQHTASIFENDATPRFVLQSDQTFGDDLQAFERMRDSWNEHHKGSKNSGKPALLEYGFKVFPLQMTPIDSQLIEQRLLSREKIAAMFGVPLHRLDQKGSKYGNVEQSNKAFYAETLAVYITRIESHLNLLLPKGFSVTLDETQFLRGDAATQTEITTKQLSMGLITINEAREKLGWSSKEGGDVHAVETNNLTFAPLEDLQAIQEENREIARQAAEASNSNQQEDQTNSGGDDE